MLDGVYNYVSGTAPTQAIDPKDIYEEKAAPTGAIVPDVEKTKTFDDEVDETYA